MKNLLIPKPVMTTVLRRAIPAENLPKWVTMKIIALFAVLVSVAASASDKHIYSVRCDSRKNAMLAVQLVADSFVNYAPEEKEMNLRKVTATVSDDETIWIGKKDILSNDKNYAPKKYKNYARFDLSKLVNTSTFGEFRPADLCRISVLFPFAAANEASSFKAPAIVNCDQSGGTMTLDCTAVKVRD